MKTEFELEYADNVVGSIKIIGQAPQHDPYVTVWIGNKTALIPDKDLERFAVNVLKALKSKKLNP